MVTKGQLIKVGVCENEQVHAICIRCQQKGKHSGQHEEEYYDQEDGLF